MPTPEQIINYFQQYYQSWGYQIIFIGAVFENIAPICYFVPGSTIVWLGAFYSYQGALSFPLVMLFGTLGAFLGHNIEYFMGRYGWYLLFKRFFSQEKLNHAKDIFKKRKYRDALILYFIGYTRSFLIVSMGILHFKYKTFFKLAFSAAFIWNLAFNLFGYLVGSRRQFFEQGLNIFWAFGLLMILSYLLGKLLNNVRKKVF